jgi:L-asparaginase II
MTLRKKLAPPIEVHVQRGGITESLHLADAVAVDSKGDVIASFGKSESQIKTDKIFPRSAVKQIQALYMMESEAVEKYSLTQKQIALACASHHGDDLQTNLVRAWHEQLNFKENQLVCGAHWPSDIDTQHEMIRNLKQPCRYHNNCSGKHTGMLTGLKAHHQPLENYQAWDHPLQQNLRRIFSELSGEDFSKAVWGVDGCGIPNYSMTLPGMARALGAFLLDPSWGKSQGLSVSGERQARMKQINQAILAEPHFISGKKSFGTEMIQALQGRAIVKVGAEGVYAALLPEAGIAFAVKVHDGASRASSVVTAFLLRAFGAITESEWVRLSDHTEPAIKNWSGDIVGKIFVPPSQFEV